MVRKIFTGTALAFSLLAGGVFTFTESADAATYTNGTHKFTSSWYETRNPNSHSMIKYGFNTTAIDEDYTWTTSTTKKTFSYVHNNSGSYSANAAAGKWAKTEVRHSGSKISYEIKF